jgi:hypothetical protein
MSNNLLPSKRIFNAIFNELVYYVENDCAEKELTFGSGHYSWWDRCMYNLLPTKFSGDLRRKLGLNYIDSVLDLSGEEYIYIRETYKRTKELYFWYLREYPFIKSPLVESPPVFKFLDQSGNETESLFSAGKLNKMHPDYIDYLSKSIDMDREQQNMLEDKLQELLKIRHIL